MSTDSGSYERKLIEAIREQETVDYCKRLIAIPSVFGSEQPIAEAVAQDLESFGLKANMVPVADSGPSVVGVVAGVHEKPRLVFNGHMDTVQVCAGWTRDPFNPTVEGDRLYGLGAVDMKGGLAAIVMAAKALVSTGVPLKHSFAVHAVSDEECWSRGTSTLIGQRYYDEVKWCIVGEPSNLMRLRNARRGQCLLDVSVAGRSTHAGQPENGINAITEGAKVVEALSRFPQTTHPRILDFKLEPLTTSSCVLKIDGGSDALSVPDRCVIRFDRHLLPGMAIKQGLEEVRSHLQHNLEGDTYGRVKVDFTPRPGLPYEPFETNPESELVKTVLGASQRVGYEPKTIAGSSVADDCLIASSCGIPVVSYGPGGDISTHASGGAHESDEFVLWRQIVDAARIYALVAYRTLG